MAACIIEAASGTPRLQTSLEELEVDLSDLHDQATRFLTACRVAPDEIPAILVAARAVTARHGTALLRVELGPTSSTATVSTSGATPPNPKSPVLAPLSTREKEADALAAGVRIPPHRLASNA